MVTVIVVGYWLGLLFGEPNPPEKEPLLHEKPVIREHEAERIAKDIEECYRSNLPWPQRIERVKLTVASIAGSDEKADRLLTNVERWRQILRLAATGAPNRSSFAPAATLMDSPRIFSRSFRRNRVFDGKIKALLSAPPDYRKQLYPVIVALYPVTQSIEAPLEDFADVDSLAKQYRAWALETYPESLRAEVILLVPILDCVVNVDEVLGRRPTWNSEQGLQTIGTALREGIRRDLPHDAARVYFDGHGSGAGAAVSWMTLSPSLNTGAILRSAVFVTHSFANCLGNPFLLVGNKHIQPFDHWREQGARLTYVENLDLRQLMSWMQQNPKNYAPQTVSVTFRDRRGAWAYWIETTDVDSIPARSRGLLCGEINAKANEVIVTTDQSVQSIRLFLNDDLLDLDHKVRVIHARENSEDRTVVFDDVVPRSLEVACDLYRITMNPGSFFCAVIDIDLQTLEVSVNSLR